MKFFVVLLLFILPLLVQANEKALTKFNEMVSAVDDLNTQSYSCNEIVSNDCPNVHVTQWCKNQYELLKQTRPVTEPSFAKGDKKKLLFLGEEHGDEQAYSYYEKLLNNKAAGFDCLFLELPTVFQKNFNNKKGIVHDRGVFTDLNKEKNPQHFSKIELIDYGYLELLESLVGTARSNKIKVVLVDSSLKSQANPTSPSEVMRRNTEMAKNIQTAYITNQCSNGLSIQGNMHLFTKSKDQLAPIDQIMKESNKELPDDQKIEIKKAFIYSAGSETMSEAMGPCSWINALPRENEIYYNGAQFTSRNRLFPEKIQESLISQYGEVDESVDYAVFLPMQMDKQYTIKKINKVLRGSIPKKFSKKTEMTIEAKNVPMSLRTNYSTLNIADAKTGLTAKCFEFCQDWNYKLVIKDMLFNEPSIRCKSYHPSRTNGATFAPILELNQTIKADCYCSKK